MDLLVKQSWTTDGSTAILDAIQVPISATYHTVYLDCSTTATSNSFFFESAQYSSGPWFVEASTTISTVVSTNFRMQISGPIGPYVRPVFGTVAATGVYHVLYVGVG